MISLQKCNYAAATTTSSVIGTDNIDDGSDEEDDMEQGTGGKINDADDEVLKVMATTNVEESFTIYSLVGSCDLDLCMILLPFRVNHNLSQLKQFLMVRPGA